MKKLILIAMLALSAGVAQANVVGDAINYLSENAVVKNDSDYVIFATDFKDYGVTKDKSDYKRIFPGESEELTPSGLTNNYLQAEVGAKIGQSGKEDYRKAIKDKATQKITKKIVTIDIKNDVPVIEQSGGDLKATEGYAATIINKSDYNLFFAESINTGIGKYKHGYKRILPGDNAKNIHIPVSDTVQFEVGQKIGKTEADIKAYKKTTEVKAKGTNKNLALPRKETTTITVDEQANPKYVIQK